MKNSIFFILLQIIVATTVFSQNPICPSATMIRGERNPIDSLVSLIGPGIPPVNPGFIIPEKRGIYWVHGFGGSISSWGNVAAATDFNPGLPSTSDYPARKTYGSLLTYATSGLEAAGKDLNDNIYAKRNALNANGITDYSNNFIIAHSQGGIVSREADYILDGTGAERDYHGIVTFGTPHQGAQILNSRDDGSIAGFASDLCSSILQVSAVNFLGNIPLVSLFVNMDNLNGNINSFCTGAATQFLPLALSDLTKGVSDSYAVGAPELTALNGYDNGSTFRAAYYGVEYSPDDPTDDGYKSKQLVWRLLGSANLVTDEPAFTGNSDQALVDNMNARYANWLSEYEFYKSRVEYLQSFGLPWICFGGLGFAPQCAWMGEYASDIAKRDAYKAASDWLGQADDQWKTIIGHTYWEPTYQCYCAGNPGNSTDLYDLIPSIQTEQACHDYVNHSQNIYDQCDWVPQFQRIVGESDGVVPANSQAGFPGVGSAGRMEYANHFQERNCTATKEALKNLFNDGGPDNINFFITEPQ